MAALQPLFDHQVFSDTLDRLALTDRVVDSHAISGLVLAILSAPELISPTEWFELVFIHDGPDENLADDDALPHQFDNAEDANDFYGQLLNLWNEWATQLTFDEPLPLPAEYGLASSGQPTAPLQAFCAGVIMGYSWLEALWSEMLAEIQESTPEVGDIFNSTLEACLLIREPDATRAALLEMEGIPVEQQMSLEEAFELLPVGLHVLASISREVVEALAEEEQGPVHNPWRDVGRNDPCPCGSGKKYKHCCLH